MSNLQHRQDKIKSRRANTDFREFIRDIGGWMSIGLRKNGNKISRYPQERVTNLITTKEFETNRDDLVNHGLGYNSSRPFLEQVTQLFHTTPLNTTIQQGSNENCDYADSILNSKNCYLSFGVFEACSNIIYGLLVTNNCKNIINSLQVTNFCDMVYNSKCIDASSFIFYSKYIINSSNIWFSSNMVGCHDCIRCDNLQNQSYCIDNIQLTREEYLAKKSEILNNKDIFDRSYSEVNNTSTNANSTNVVGNSILFSSNISNGYYVTRANTGHNTVLITGENQDSSLYDCMDAGINAVDFYAVQGGGTNANNYYCVGQSESCFNIYYSYYLYRCSFCLGCVGLRNKEYCILNKQYTKEEWYEKVDEIFSQMDVDGTLGQFFPASMNPFYFNDTAAYLIDPSFTKEEVTAKGYLRRDEPIKVDIPEGAQTVATYELGQFEKLENGVRTIDEEICKKVIVDHEGNAYRIIPMELEFLRKHGLPLPRKHWLDRMKENFSIN